MPGLRFQYRPAVPTEVPHGFSYSLQAKWGSTSKIENALLSKPRMKF
jgi:hypothetical protein